MEGREGGKERNSLEGGGGRYLHTSESKFVEGAEGRDYVRLSMHYSICDYVFSISDRPGEHQDEYSFTPT